MLLQDIMLDDDRICFMHVITVFLIYFPRFFSLLGYEMFKTRFQMDKSDFTRFKTWKNTLSVCFWAMLLVFHI